MAEEKSNEQHEAGFHEIAGVKVGEKNVPLSTIFVFLFILFIASIAWITVPGF